MLLLQDRYLKPADPVFQPEAPTAFGLVQAVPFSERDGGTVRDLSGCNTDGTFTNGKEWGVGPLGPTARTDGTSWYVDFGKIAKLDVSGNLNLSLWVRPMTNGGSGGYLWADFDAAGNNSQGSLYILAGKVGWFQSGGGANFQSTLTFAAGDLLHIVVVRDNTAKTIIIFVNGVQWATATYTGNPTAQASCGNRVMGRAGSFNGNYAHAWYSDLRVAKDAPPWTAGQVQDLYSEGRWRLYQEPLWYPGPLATGTAWVQSLAETLALSDARVLGVGRVLAESLALAESRGLGIGRALGETLSLTDSRQLASARALTETLSLSDLRGVGLAKALAETLTLTDTRALGITRALTETLSLSDTAQLALVLLISLTEALTFTEALSRGAGKRLAESLEFTDARGLGSGRGFTESLSLADARGLGAQKGLAESLALSDDLARGSAKSLAESLSLTETRGLAAARVLTEELSLSDLVFALLGGAGAALVLHLVETLSLEDTAAVWIAVLRYLATLSQIPKPVAELLLALKPVAELTVTAKPVAAWEN